MYLHLIFKTRETVSNRELKKVKVSKKSYSRMLDILSVLKLEEKTENRNFQYSSFYGWSEPSYLT